MGLCVQPRHLVDEIPGASVWLAFLDLADVFAGRDTAEDLQPAREVARRHEARQVGAALVVVIIVGAPDGRDLDHAVVRSALPPLGKAVLPTVF